MSDSQSRKLALIFNVCNLYDSDVASYWKDTKEINLRYGENQIKLQNQRSKLLHQSTF